MTTAAQNKSYSAFMVVRYRDSVQPGAGMPAQTLELEDGTTCPIVHRTKAAAESAMLGMCPIGVTPLAYSGLRVERHWITGYEYVQD